MSYQVLARKWRPKTFHELVGQTHVVDALTNALNNDKLHHAYLFTGTRGVGKTTIARIFAKSINCDQGQSANPCGKCDTCQDINQGRYVDLLEIDAASRTKVEDTRELLDNVQYKPTRGRFKVYLIDEVHMLSKHSFNALLKTLEEPPEHVKFLLATTDPQKLPVTVLSRCLQFNLRQLSKEQISQQLTHILTHENIPFEAEAVLQLAKAARGSMRDALSLTDQAIAQSNNNLKHKNIVDMLGLIDRQLVLKLVKAVAEKQNMLSMQLFDEIAKDSPDYAQLIGQVMALLHQVSLAQLVPQVCVLETEHPRAIFALAKALSPEHVQLLYQIALQGKRDLPYAPDPHSGAQMTLLRMLAFSPVSTISLDPQDFTVSVATDDRSGHDIDNPMHSEPQVMVQEDYTESVVTATGSSNPESIPSQGPEVEQDAIMDIGPEAELPLDQRDLKATLDNMDALTDLLSSDSTSQEGTASNIKKPDEPSRSVERSALHDETVLTSLATDEIQNIIKPVLDDSKEKLILASQIDQWSRLIDQLDVSGMTRQMLLHSALISLAEDSVSIALPEDSKHLLTDSHVATIEQQLSQHFGRTLKLEVRIQDALNSPINLQGEINRMRQQHAEQTVQKDRLIQDLLTAFDATVIDGSIRPK